MFQKRIFNLFRAVGLYTLEFFSNNRRKLPNFIEKISFLCYNVLIAELKIKEES